MSDDIEVWADLSLPVRSDAVTSHSIGGTMGLLTGFSIISGVEIVYFIAKLVLNVTNRNKSSN